MTLPNTLAWRSELLPAAKAHSGSVSPSLRSASVNWAAAWLPYSKLHCPFLSFLIARICTLHILTSINPPCVPGHLAGQLQYGGSVEPAQRSPPRTALYRPNPE